MGVVEVGVPSSPLYVRDYKQEAATESASRKRHRSERNKARRMAEAFYGASAIRGKDIDHKQELDQGGSNKLFNLHPVSPAKNRSYPRTRSGQMRRGK